MKTFITLYILLIASVCFANITLIWDANTETDLAGYVIYYGYNSGIYNGVDLNEGPSPIVLSVIDGNHQNYIPNVDPEFTLTGENYTSHDYYFVLTAYDDEDPTNESGYSNEVNTIEEEEDEGENSGSGSGGSGDSGCFINSVR